MIEKISVMGSGNSILQSQEVGRQIRQAKERINKLNPNITKGDSLGTIDKDGNVVFNWEK